MKQTTLKTAPVRRASENENNLPEAISVRLVPPGADGQSLISNPGLIRTSKYIVSNVFFRLGRMDGME